MTDIRHLIDDSEPGAWARALRHREEARVELPAQHQSERLIAGEGEGRETVHTQSIGGQNG